MNNNLRLAIVIERRNLYFKILRDSDSIVPVLENDRINVYGLKLFERECLNYVDSIYSKAIHNIISKYMVIEKCTLTGIMNMILDIELNSDIDISKRSFI